MWLDQDYILLRLFFTNKVRTWSDLPAVLSGISAVQIAVKAKETHHMNKAPTPRHYWTCAVPARGVRARDKSAPIRHFEHSIHVFPMDAPYVQWALNLITYFISFWFEPWHINLIFQVFISECVIFIWNKRYYIHHPLLFPLQCSHNSRVILQTGLSHWYNFVSNNVT